MSLHFRIKFLYHYTLDYLLTISNLFLMKDLLSFFNRINKIKNKKIKNNNKKKMTRSEEHTSELQSPCNLVCRLLLEKKITLVIPIARGSSTLVYAFARLRTTSRSADSRSISCTPTSRRIYGAVTPASDQRWIAATST